MKHDVLKKYAVPDAVWVETGTYLGETARFLAQFAKRVITIEPSTELHSNARIALADLTNVLCVEGSSGEVLEGVVEGLVAQQFTSICFWLDGHYSGPGTFMNPVHTPILRELEILGETLDAIPSFVIFIDDFRLFRSWNFHYRHYPRPSQLKRWARSRNLTWTVEDDVFVIFSA